MDDLGGTAICVLFHREARTSRGRAQLQRGHRCVPEVLQVIGKSWADDLNGGFMVVQCWFNGGLMV